MSLNELKQMLTKEGHVQEEDGRMSYVANDFLEKIMTSASHEKSVDVPSINPELLDKLENDCVLLTSSFNEVVGELNKRLQKISAISVGNTQACCGKIDDMHKCVDSAVHNMYSLIAHSEELNRSMKLVYQLSNNISNLKEIVVTLERHLHS